MRSLRFGVLGVLLVVFCLSAAGLGWLILNSDEDDSGGGKKIVYGLTLNPSGFDPHIHLSNELGIPFYSVYDTLIYRHPEEMVFVPGLAATLPEMSPDGLSWTFTLRQDVTFHDGEPFNAAAVAANLDRIMDPDIASQKARGLLGPYTHYTIEDEYTITLHLAEPYAPLLDGLSQVYLGMASPKALAETTKNTYQWHQVGTGPYMLDEIVPGERVVLRRNPDYAWGPVFYAPVTDDSVEVIEFRFYTDAATRSQALESGAVQMIGELLPRDAELLAGNEEVRTLNTAITGMPQQFFFNTQKRPTDEEAVRKALIYATNRTAMVDGVFQGQSPVAHGPLTAVTPFYDPDLAREYVFDADYARELLRSVGFEPNNDGIMQRGGEELELTVVFAPWGQLDEVAQLLQSQWAEIGIKVNLVFRPTFLDLQEQVASGDYHLVAFNDFGADASLLNPFYFGDGPLNWSGYADEELDNWLLEAVREPDFEKRAALYRSIQWRIMDRAVILPIRDYVNLNGFAARLDGVKFSGQGWWPLLRNLQLRG